jgi:hypothetical protein
MAWKNNFHAMETKETCGASRVNQGKMFYFIGCFTVQSYTVESTAVHRKSIGMP